MTPSGSARPLYRAVFAVAVLGIACSFDARPRFGHRAPDDDRQRAPAAPVVGASPTTEPSPPVQEAGPLDAPVADAPVRGRPATEDVDAAMPPVSDAHVDAPEAGPDAAVDSGEPDAATADAAPADAGTAADAMTSDAADRGGPFNPCEQHADCDTGLFCTAMAAWAMPGGGGYCTTYCGTGWAVVCPQPSSGSVQAACQFATRLCELGSCERLQCPAGLRCVHTETQLGGGQVYHAFDCR